MRALYVFLVGSLLTPLVWAQAINVTNQGVGLNTSNPEAKWDIYAGTLGNAAGNTFNYASLSSHSANYDRLLMKSVREAPGASWETASFLLQRKVDFADMGYVKFNGRDLALGSGPIEAVRILENGNLGIGTPNPSARLTVSSVQSFSGTAISKHFLVNAGVLGYNLGAEVVITSLGLFTGNENVLGVRARRVTAGSGWESVSFGLGIDVDSTKQVNGSGLWFNPNGSIGIATVSSTHKLNVNGQVKARGYITDNTNWADHVFAEDYNLAPLDEVEAHIKEKRHLPGIPSAAEVKAAGGVELGDMQVKLLAKVEELTLHLIALEKQVRSQQARIAELESGKL